MEELCERFGGILPIIPVESANAENILMTAARSRCDHKETSMNVKSRSHVRAVIVVMAMALALVTAILAGPVDQAQASLIAEPSNYPVLDLGSTTRGNEAILALGTDLPAVASAYGTTTEELRRRLLSDPTLAVDRHGRLFYTDPGIPSSNGAAMEPAGAPLAPLEDTFLLHSRPGANRVIYLDFDGGVLTGTAWNDTENGGPDTQLPGLGHRRNPLRLRRRRAHRHTADLAAGGRGLRAVRRRRHHRGAAGCQHHALQFVGDTVYGTRALISPISSYFGNYGGIAYVGIYNQVDTTDYYKPALIFPENLANGEKYIAEAVTHEVGHNVGLSHDGTTSSAPGGAVGYYQGQGSGTTGWAPIMGVGYYQNLSQWSKGEYAYANNTEDDLVVIQNHGLSYRADDYGNTIATASGLPGGTATGVITTTADIDIFSFVAGAGTVTFAVDPIDRGPDLDIQADVLNAGGSVLGTSNPTGRLDADLSVVLPSAGTYYLRVQGVGEGSPTVTGYTDYASLGQYIITGSVSGPTVTLDTSVSAGSGSITRNPDQTTYTQGASVTLTAVPASGYTFTGWGGDAERQHQPACRDHEHRQVDHCEFRAHVVAGDAEHVGGG